MPDDAELGRVVSELAITYSVRELLSRIEERQAQPIRSRVQAFGVNTFTKLCDAMTYARSGMPAFHEAHVTLKADHLNMASLLPTLGLS